jgi:hypothetical protein
MAHEGGRPVTRQQRAVFSLALEMSGGTYVYIFTALEVGGRATLITVPLPHPDLPSAAR